MGTAQAGESTVDGQPAGRRERPTVPRTQPGSARLLPQHQSTQAAKAPPILYAHTFAGKPPLLLTVRVHAAAAAVQHRPPPCGQPLCPRAPTGQSAKAIPCAAPCFPLLHSARQAPSCAESLKGTRYTNQSINSTCNRLDRRRRISAVLGVQRMQSKAPGPPGAAGGRAGGAALFYKLLLLSTL